MKRSWWCIFGVHRPYKVISPTGDYFMCARFGCKWMRPVML